MATITKSRPKNGGGIRNIITVSAKPECVRCGFAYRKDSGDIFKVGGKWLCRWDIDKQDYKGVN